MNADLKKVMTGIEGELEGRTTGFAIAIRRHGELVLSTSGGWATFAPAPREMDSRVRIGLHSCGKTLTAAAVVHALAAKGRSLDEPVHPFLPPMWELGPNVKALTFRMLLTHTSGLSGTHDAWDAMEQVLAKGIGKGPHAPSYANINFSLFRIILPAVVSPGIYGGKPGMLGAMNGSAFVTYVQRHILKPCGVEGPDVGHTGPGPATRYYNFQKPSVSFAALPAKKARPLSGAGWWAMSVREFSKVIDGLRRDLVAGVWDTMVSEAAPNAPDSRLGMYRHQGKAGDYFDHNGGVTNGAGAGGFADWMAFPDGVTVVIAANSQPVPDGSAPEIIVRNAFEAALGVPVG